MPVLLTLFNYKFIYYVCLSRLNDDDDEDNDDAIKRNPTDEQEAIMWLNAPEVYIYFRFFKLTISKITMHDFFIQSAVFARPSTYARMPSYTPY